MDYDMILASRKPQVENLLYFLSSQLSFGKSILSIGCGTAPELEFLSGNGIDHDSEVVEFCRTKGKQVMHTSFITYLEQSKQIFDTIFVLDIDTNIFLDSLIHLASKRLKKGGNLIISERENNINIYRRYLLLPHIERIKRDFSGFDTNHYFRVNPKIDHLDRDNFVLVMKKI